MQRLDGLDERALILDDGWLEVLRYGAGHSCATEPGGCRTRWSEDSLGVT
jgi:hypothetical protein